MIAPPPIAGWRTVDGVVVHIGAGDGAECGSYIRFGAARVVLIEPDARYVNALNELKEREPKVEVIRVAVSDASGSGELHRYNLPGLASLRRIESPTIWPGLRCLDSAIVSVATIPELMSRIKPEGHRKNWLIIDTPGDELSILEALRRHTPNQLFKQLTIRFLPFEPHLEEACRARALDLLELAGYRLVHTDNSLTGAITYHATADRSWASLKLAESNLLEAQNKIRSLHQDLRLNSDKARCEVEAKEAQCKDAETKVAALEDRLRLFEKKIESLRKQVKEAEQQRVAVQGEIQAAESQLDVIKDLLLRDK